jgi:hypothetical protein
MRSTPSDLLQFKTNFWNYGSFRHWMDSIGGRGREFIPSQGALSTQNSRRTETTGQTFTPYSGNRIYDLIVRTAEGITCLNPGGHVMFRNITTVLCIRHFFPLALQPQFWPWPTSMKLSVSLYITRSWTFGRTPCTGDQLVARPLPVHKHRKTHTHTQTPNIHALNEIRTHDPGFRASEDSTCPRPLGYCDRRIPQYYIYIVLPSFK